MSGTLPRQRSKRRVHHEAAELACELVSGAHLAQNCGKPRVSLQRNTPSIANPKTNRTKVPGSGTGVKVAVNSAEFEV